MDSVNVVCNDSNFVTINSNILCSNVQSQDDITALIWTIEKLVTSKDASKFVKTESLQLLWIIFAFLRVACNPEDFSIASALKILSACAPSPDRDLKTIFDIMVEDLSDPSTVFIKEQYAYFKYSVFGTYSGFYGSIVTECKEILHSVSDDEVVSVYNNDNTVSSELGLKNDVELFGKLMDQAKISPYEAWDTAIHEAGHAVAHYLFDSDFCGITIVPADNYSGLVKLAQEQTFNFEKEAIFMLAGDAADEVFGLLRPCRSLVCSHDFKHATAFLKDEIISRVKDSDMLHEYVFIDREVLGLKEKESPYIVYETIKRCVELREDATKLIQENRDLVEALALELLEKKSMAGEEVKVFLDHCYQARETRVNKNF